MKRKDEERREGLQPTTAGISAQLMNDVVYLDTEGEDGSTIPINDQLVQHVENTEKDTIEEYNERRRTAVAKSIPQVCYLTSNVVVYISKHSFAEHSMFFR